MNWTTLFKKFTNGKYIVGLLAVIFLSIGSFTSAYSTNYTYNCTVSDSYCYIFNANNSHFLNNVKSIELLSIPSGISYFNISVSMGNGGTATPSSLKKVGDIMNINGHINSLNIIGEGEYIFKITYPDPPLINGGTSNFTPIITKLGNIAVEFIPYMLYIAIACLGVTLAFKALKYIISYLQGKAKGAVRGK